MAGLGPRITPRWGGGGVQPTTRSADQERPRATARRRGRQSPPLLIRRDQTRRGEGSAPGRAPERWRRVTQPPRRGGTVPRRGVCACPRTQQSTLMATSTNVATPEAPSGPRQGNPAKGGRSFAVAKRDPTGRPGTARTTASSPVGVPNTNGHRCHRGWCLCGHLPLLGGGPVDPVHPSRLATSP